MGIDAWVPLNTSAVRHVLNLPNDFYIQGSSFNIGDCPKSLEDPLRFHVRSAKR